MDDAFRALLDWLFALDTQTALFVSEIRTPLVTKLFTSVTGLGSATAALVFLGLFWTAGWRETTKTLMATVTRPFPPRPVCQTTGAAVASSFPSGHAAAATVFTVTAWRSESLPVAAVAPLALAVAVSRVYLGTHYLSDTVAGIAIGIGAVAVAGALLTRWEPPSSR
ncbi:glucose-6-phosphatase [Halobacteriales archaeon SW_8_65_20]|nr:MAG: glucose-6-phosphatase [Halobacteriales archaeon SW_8_65_20]